MTTDGALSVAGVHILDLPYHADRVYDYRIPETLRGTVEVGDIVAVPFGMSSRGQQAVVTRLSASSEFPDLKEITAKCGVSLPPEMTGLCDYMKEHFLCSYGEAARVMAPTYAVPLLRNRYIPAGNGKKAYGKTEREILDYVTSRGGADGQTLVKKFSLKSQAPLRRLVAEGILKCETVLAERQTPADERVSLREEFLRLAPEELRALVRGEKQKEVLSFLSISGEETLSSVYSETGAGRVTVKSLEKNGFVRIIRTEKYRDPYAGLDTPAPFPVLSGEQKEAADRINALCEGGKPACALLYGVTGSGKTSVIGQVIDNVIGSGRQVIMLVPEISLTPQAVKIFYNRYPGRVAVLHSGLSDGERYDAWNRIRRGDVSLCIGTRSAVFAPFKKLGLIVIDEEQDGSYKSDSPPRYHARDVARYRCANENAVLLLSSATPSLGSFMNAKNGSYTLVTLKSRYGGATLPRTVIADMRKEAGLPPIGEELKKALSGTLERKEQAILFINRRGYHSFLSCTLCGKTLGCPHCSVTYTYHLRGRGDRGYLYCHYCGSKAFVPSSCQCGGKFRYTGVGTQQVEDEIIRLFPAARVLRLDSDTTSSRFAYDRILGDFRNGEADVLVGTQMVTKGHDFPGVTLVGVINADTALFNNDYSAAERAFSLFTQVTGRSGRSSRPGVALLQSHNPEHPILSGVISGDYEGMYENEIALRRSLAFPPYVNMVVLSASSPDEKILHGYVGDLCGYIKNHEAADAPMRVFGPVEAPVYKIGGVFRLQIVIKCVLNRPTRRHISEIYSQGLGMAGSRVSLTADVDPVSL